MLEAILGIVTGIAVAAIIIALQLRADVREARARNTDLHNRLASRTYGEYAAFNSPLVATTDAPHSESRTLYDNTGLIEADAYIDD